MTGERVVIAANETEAREWRELGSNHVIVNVALGPRAVEGMRVRSIDIASRAAAEHENFLEMYRCLRRSQMGMGA